MEIGGYLDIEKNRGTLFHENAWRLVSGRSCLEWLIKEKDIKKIALPWLICDAVEEVCSKCSVEIVRYNIGINLQPINIQEDSSCWVYLINYYGQLGYDTVESYIKRDKDRGGAIAKYAGIILDNTQAYFDNPISGAYTIYSCRKYFGVPDGAFFYGDDLEGYDDLECSYSADFAHHLLGRFEGTASNYYKEFKDNDDRLKYTGIKKMSVLTENMLKGIDYEFVKRKRTENYIYLDEKLAQINRLEVKPIDGAFAYPFWVKNGKVMREKLISAKVYVPILWPNVISGVDNAMLEYDLALNILPLPCDQRYGMEEMQRICEVIAL